MAEIAEEGGGEAEESRSFQRGKQSVRFHRRNETRGSRPILRGEEPGDAPGEKLAREQFIGSKSWQQYGEAGEKIAK